MSKIQNIDDDDDAQAEFTQLFDSFFAVLVQIVWYICARREVAEEIAQEAFLRYYEKMHKLPRGNEARFWLIRVVKNLSFNYEKRRGREGYAYREYSVAKRNFTGNEGEKSVLEEETKAQVRAAVKMLPYNLRMALILREYAGYSYAEIAKIMRVSDNNVKVRVFRARKRLAKILDKEELYVP